MLLIVLLWGMCAEAASNPHPSQFAVTAAPAKDLVVEGRAGLGYSRWPRYDEALGLGLRVSRPLQKRLHLDGVATMLLGAVRCSGFLCPSLRADLRLGAAVVAEEQVRVVGFVGLGTSIQAGIAGWIRVSDRWSLDASLPVALDTRTLLALPGTAWDRRSGTRWKVASLDSIPELGLTWQIRYHTSLRMGVVGYTPVMTWHFSKGRFGISATGGITPMSVVGKGTLYWRL